jgi:hypothetical protein
MSLKRVRNSLKVVFQSQTVRINLVFCSFILTLKLKTTDEIRNFFNKQIFFKNFLSLLA